MEQIGQKVPRHPKHPDYVIGYRGPRALLAPRVVQADFNARSNFLYEFGLDIAKQGVDDDLAGRKKLGRRLVFAGCYLLHAQPELRKAAKAYDQERPVPRPGLVLGYRSSLRQLAHNIGRMSFDKVVLFVRQLSALIRQEAEEYVSRNKATVRKALLAAAQFMEMAESQLVLAWRICQPYMP